MVSRNSNSEKGGRSLRAPLPILAEGMRIGTRVFLSKPSDLSAVSGSMTAFALCRMAEHRIRKGRDVMLQAVHKKVSDAQASSLYCVWVPGGGSPDSRQTAIWIDSSMGAFGAQCAGACGAPQVTKSAADGLTPVLIKHSL